MKGLTKINNKRIIHTSNGMYSIRNHPHQADEDRYNDLLYIKHLLRNFRQLRATIYLSSNEELVCTLIDIGRALPRIPLGEIQKEILEMYMDGYTPQEISRIRDCSNQAVHYSLLGVCKKIRKELTNES